MIEINGVKYYSPKEVAEKFNVTIGTVAKWRQLGKIKPYKMSQRKFVYSENSLEKMIQGIYNE